MSAQILQLPVNQQHTFHNHLINSVPLVKKNDGTLKPENTISNCVFILENEPYLSGRLKYNELSNVIEIVKPFPWHDPNKFKARPLSDTEETRIRHYYERYDMKNIKQHLNDAIRIVADGNRYHPIKEYFNTLKWDKQPRIDTLLQKLFKIESNTYHSEVLKIFMVGAVSRIYDAGCKFDYMPILIGNQGIRKSTFFKVLSVKPEWYLEDLRSVDKAGIEQIQGKWIVEWGELNAMSKAKEVAGVKIFITTTNDTARMAYDRYVSNFQRQCVFCGTTNENTFLHDKTGNRRFLPIKANIPCGETIDTNYLASIVDQLWAEALEIYQSGYLPVLSSEAQKIAFELQENAMDEDVNFGLIQNFLESNGWGSGKAPTEVCSKMLWEYAIQSKREMRRNDSVDIARIMDKMPNWKRYNGSKDGRKNIVGYGYQYCWIKE